MEWLGWTIFLIIAGLLIFISWQDTRFRIISHKSLMVLLCLIVALLAVKWQFPHIVAALAVIAVFFPLFVCNIIGGGDVKMIAVLSLSLSWLQLVDFLLLTAFIGGAIGIIGLIFFRKTTKTRGIPYGVAISCAYIFIYTPLI